MQAELLDHRRVGLRAGAHLEAGLRRIAPVAFFGAGRLERALRTPASLKFGIGRRADRVLAVRIRRAGRIAGKAARASPSRRASLPSSSIALARLSMPGFFLSALSPFSPIQKKFCATRPASARAILLLGDGAELLAERLEARIADRRRRADRHRLVGLGRRPAAAAAAAALLRRRGWPRWGGPPLAAGRRQLCGAGQLALRLAWNDGCGEQQRGSDRNGSNDAVAHRVSPLMNSIERQ